MKWQEKNHPDWGMLNRDGRREMRECEQTTLRGSFDVKGERTAEVAVKGGGSREVFF